MRYVVTGGAGFIGSHIVEELVLKNEEVIVIDNLVAGKEENIKPVLSKIKFVKGSILDQDLLNREFKEADFILHQAALRSVPESFDNPKDYNEVNITGTLNVLEAALKNNVRRVIFASSSSVYGENEALPQNESLMPKPVSPYALTKIAGEHYCQMYWKTYGLETVSLRYFNVFGPRQDPSSQYAVAIPTFIIRMLKNERPTIFGDGEQSRDFTYVKNVVEGNLLACTAKKAAGEAMNLANGERTTLNQIIALLNKFLNSNTKPIYDEPRKGDPRHTQADNTKAKELLGYKGHYNFEQGLGLTLDWFQKNLK